MKVGIAGGIGSGKSYVCERLALRGIEVYDCDRAAKRLIRTSPIIYKELTRLIGPDAYANNRETINNNRGEGADNGYCLLDNVYCLNKAAVARFLLESEANAKAIDAIVHPAVFRDFEESGMEWMESAIMYESGIYRLVDRVVVVTAPEEVRIRRIMQRDGISREKAVQWMQRQWPQERVRALADYEIVNDGASDVDAQVEQLLARLSHSA